MERLPNSASLAFVESLYADYLRDPNSVAPEWRSYFAELGGDGGARAEAPLGPSFRPPSIFNPGDGARAAYVDRESAALQDRVSQLIRNYRVRGHIAARVDPLGRARPEPPELQPEFYGFSAADMDRVFSCETLDPGRVLPLRAIFERLKNTYCRSIGAQFMHIDDLATREWLQARMEGTQNRLQLTREEQIRIFTKLTDAVIFEEFVQKKFVGAKSFSLEGGESLIPLLDLAIERAAEHGIEEIVFGMAHRGRLNVLANIIGKSPRQIFREFEDRDPQFYQEGGDVKYHLGYSKNYKTAHGTEIHLALMFNPSHLEFVNPVALGRMRAKQDRIGDRERARGMVILIHGDASFAGEGVVQESLNLSQLEGYTTGGTLHVIVNNQIGFTTDPEEGRSSVYATDVAKMLQIPIFHVNGEDPEAVAQVVRLAMDFRREFKRDVVIDMYCYRRRGHNETDEPTFTQPLMYREIERRPSVRDSYLEHLLELKELTRAEADEIAARRRSHLEAELSVAQREPARGTEVLEGIWKDYRGGPEKDAPDVDTGVEPARLAGFLQALTRLPEGFHLHPKLRRALKARADMARGKAPLDWSAAEALALASLAAEGIRVRLTGQDTARGTFSQRHAVLHDFENGQRYMPLQHVAAAQAPVEIYNSPLSEVGVLGFEYGYSIGCPDGLVMWEAQFGDFVNAAQVIVDQFIASAETKWRRLSGLVLLLPHGLEGMGPEHSSARFERFLQLGAKDNLQVVYPTTPAQYFHVLRRQALRRWRKPLVVLTPKSLLRHPLVTSKLEELGQGRFRRVIADASDLSPERVERVLLCSGKIYYELLKKRADLGQENIPLIRVEQLYPFPEEELRAVLSRYPETTRVLWVQEEPENMGAWHYLRARFGERLFGRFALACVARPESASPATGSASGHKREQERLLKTALAGA
ncbi:MAG TPA: 2-oxoglutarate dehydrogenase E1 component [Candidatus Acidoferrales bacterium]|nr:2-oxoglutarate dehydrogenase E1 component [Candidatus Acidoferrales bacterium]